MIEPAPLRILVLGASGLIGSAIARWLVNEGYIVLGMARNIEAPARRWPEIVWHRADIAKLLKAEDWSALLGDVDVVVNASGALQDGPGNDLRALQVDAMRALFDACSVQDKRVIQISAAGVETAQARFMALKHESDSYLRGSACEWTILRPGFVLAPMAYGGSAMLRALAAMPFAIPLAFGDRELRIVHVDDVADAVSRVVAGSAASRQTYDLVSSVPETFADVVVALRDWLGLRRVPLLPVPTWLVKAGFKLGDFAGALGWTPPMRSASLVQMANGVSGDPTLWERTSGTTMAPAKQSLSRIPAGVQEVWFARLWLLKPVILVTLALFWIFSGVIGLLRMEHAMAILPETFPGLIFVLGGAIADIGIGMAIAVRKTSRIGLIAALLLSLGYLAGSVLVTPGLWLDPLGPMLKVIPSMVLTLVALAILEDR